MAHGDAREGKWRGNWRMEWVASTLHTTSEHGVSSITTADAHTSAASSRLNWCPVDLNGLVRVAERRNLVSAHVPSHFNWPLPITLNYQFFFTKPLPNSYNYVFWWWSWGCRLLSLGLWRRGVFYTIAVTSQEPVTSLLSRLWGGVGLGVLIWAGRWYWFTSVRDSSFQKFQIHADICVCIRLIFIYLE